MGDFHKLGVYTSESNIDGLIRIVTRSYVLKKDAEKAARESYTGEYNDWLKLCAVQNGKTMHGNVYFWDLREVWVKTDRIRDVLGVMNRDGIKKLLDFAKTTACGI